MAQLPYIVIRSGKASEFPVRAPNRQAGFWDQDNNLLYIATDDLNWELINTAAGTANVFIYISSFTYATISPLAMFVGGASDRIERMKIEIGTAFDGTSSITVGDAGDTDRFFQSSELDLSEAGMYEKSLNYEFPGSTQVNLYLSIAGATQGSGEVVTVIRKN